MMANTVKDPLALPPDFNHYLAYVSAGFFFFVVVHGFTSYYFVPASASSSKKHRWKWSNIFTSLVHSCITGVWAPLAFYLYPAMCENMIDTYNDFAHVLVSFSIGYFLYDFMDMALYNPKRSTYELLVHHACVVVCFGIPAYTKRYLPYASAALIVEINSVFLHARQLLIIQGASKQSVVYRNVALLNVATFVLFRILLLGWMTRWLTVNRDLISTSFFTCGSVGLATVIAMNSVLFYRILNRDFFSCSNSSSTISDKKVFSDGGSHPVSKDINRIMKTLFEEDAEGEDAMSVQMQSKKMD